MSVAVGPSTGSSRSRADPAVRCAQRTGDWARRAPLLPALIFMIVVTQLPFVATLVISFFDWNAFYPDERGFAGLRQLPTRAHRREPARLGLHHRPAHRVGGARQPGPRPGCSRCCWTASSSAAALVRTLLIAPFLVVPVAAALLWKHALYNPEYGLLNGSLHWSGAVRQSTTRRSRTGSPSTPLPAVEVSLVWQWTPFMMLILLAGLQSRPLDVIEAARIDGASAWQIFRYLTLPHLRRTSSWAPCSARSTSCRTSTRSSRSPRAAWARRTCRTRSTRPSTRPTTTAGPPPRASWW